jgi:hypothetical protein
MSASTTIPVTVTPEAADRVAELGMQAELERMIEHARQTLPGLHRLDVILEPPYDTGPTPYLTVKAQVERNADYRRTKTAWEDWFIVQFPPEVREHITLMFLEAPRHAG